MKKISLLLSATLLSAVVAATVIYFDKNDTEETVDVHFKPKTPTSTADKGNTYIFFDVGGVLLKNSTSSAIKAVGVSNMFWYTYRHKKKPDHYEVQARLFDFIDYCMNQPRGLAKVGGAFLPQIMCEWAKGTIKTKKLVETILSYKKEANEFFESKEEKNLVLGTLNLFQPKVINKIQRPIVPMIELFEECCEAFPGKVYILSNWDAESAKLIRKKYPEIFKAIPESHILFSGDINQLKPEKEIYRYATKKLKLNPHNCILIDDHSENTDSARSCGWRTILHKHPNQTAHELERLIK